jgi:hypothetical protein
VAIVGFLKNENKTVLVLRKTSTGKRKIKDVVQELGPERGGNLATLMTNYYSS